MKHAMKRLLSAVLLFTLAGVYTGCSGTEETTTPSADWSLAAKSQPATRWFWLFAGRTLDTWMPRGGDAAWQVEEGAITAVATEKPSYIATRAAYDNFALTVDVWMDAGHDTGIFIRGPAAEDTTTPINHKTGYEINIADRVGSAYPTGSIVGIAKYESAPATAEKWNTVEITADGDHIVVRLNGRVTADIHDSTHTSGVIAFEASGHGQVKFRNIKFRPLE